MTNIGMILQKSDNSNQILIKYCYGIEIKGNFVASNYTSNDGTIQQLKPLNVITWRLTQTDKINQLIIEFIIFTGDKEKVVLLLAKIQVYIGSCLM
jgi:hypothetical protein